MAKQEPYSKMSDYRPKLPSNNAYDQELAIDPFTGQPFGYRLTGERYQLSSAGIAGNG